MRILIDSDEKKSENKTIIRNKICERILKKESLLELVEQYVFRANQSKQRYIKPLADFVFVYEK